MSFSRRIRIIFKTSIALLIVPLLVGAIPSLAPQTGLAHAMISPDAKTAPGLSVDASSSSFCDHSTNSCSTILKTSHTNDVVIVYAIEALDLQPSCTFTVTDKAGLAWAARTGVVFGNSNRDQLQEFWATSSHKLAGDTITESILGCAGGFGGEYNGLMTFAVAGATLPNPFDPNTTVPGTASGTGTVASVNVTTTNPNDMIIGGTRFGLVASPGAGFTQITFTDTGHDVAEFMLSPQPATNLSVTFTTTSSANWMIIADALH